MYVEIDVVFHSSGTPMAGRFLRNTEDVTEQQPCILITGSWLTVKEQMPTVYAKRLVEQGYTAFIYDFRGFGKSQGEPRQAEIPARKIDDIRAAVDFVKTFSFVNPDKVGCVAVCASAQYTLAALGRGLPIASFASVAGWYHDAASVAPFYGGGEGVGLRLNRAKEAVQTYLDSGKVVVVPAFEDGNDRAAMFFPVPYYGEPGRGAVPEWKNEMAEMSWLYWLTFDGLSAAKYVSTPSLFFHSDDCVLPNHAKQAYETVKGEKELVWSEGAQIDFYDLPAHVDRAMSALTPWFQKTLKGV
ncbi:MAG: alpha/beta hydrolase [Cyanobacteria bacterium P01_H01_bin.153]